MTPITQLTPEQVAHAMERRTVGDYWHTIARDLGVRPDYLQDCVKRAKVHGLAVFKTTDANAVKGITQHQHS